MRKQQPVVGVIFGSRSTEHDVSVVTAIASIIGPLELSEQYEVLPVYIANDGHWYCHEDLSDIALYSSGGIDEWLARHEPVAVALEPGAQKLKLLAGSGMRRREILIDIVFPALHGTHGEDGEVMGLLELSGVPYVGCSVAASAIAMDKVLTKLAVNGAGIDITKFEYFTKHEFESDPDEWVTRINRHLRYPLFVKPAHLGSSIGITRVADPEKLRDAIEVALHYDTKALVEEGVENLIEVTLPIMGDDVAGEPPRPALLERPMVHSQDFFDFDTKYMHGGKKGGKGGGGKSRVKGAHGYSELPARLDTALYAKAEATGLAVYRALGCSGISRVDMLIDSKEGVVYCNEVNPLPGSLYAHNWSEAGVSNVKLVTELVRLALARHERRTAIETSFSTNFLKQF